MLKLDLLLSRLLQLLLTQLRNLVRHLVPLLELARGSLYLESQHYQSKRTINSLMFDLTLLITYLAGRMQHLRDAVTRSRTSTETARSSLARQPTSLSTP